MLPATATLKPARSTNNPVREVTVVLPLVPVMAKILGLYACVVCSSASDLANTSNSPPTHKPMATAADHTGATLAGVKPGLLNTARTSVPCTKPS